MGLAELGDRGGLARPGCPDKIMPRRALMACRFSRVSRRPVVTTCRKVEVAAAASLV
jgi:hypothetical protein